MAKDLMMKHSLKAFAMTTPLPTSYSMISIKTRVSPKMTKVSNPEIFKMWLNRHLTNVFLTILKIIVMGISPRWIFTLKHLSCSRLEISQKNMTCSKNSIYLQNQITQVKELQLWHFQNQTQLKPIKSVKYSI